MQAMFRKHVILFALTLLILAVGIGCGSANPAAVAGKVDLQPTVDTATLPLNIDVTTTNALRGRPDVVLIDVREPWEYQAGHIPGVVLIPMGEIPSRLAELPTDKTLVITCRSGNRSDQVTDFLRAQGFDKAHNMAGGILAWEAARLPVER
jgi:rhodanese-related sulfurtransferase